MGVWHPKLHQTLSTERTGCGHGPWGGVPAFLSNIVQEGKEEPHVWLRPPKGDHALPRIPTIDELLSDKADSDNGQVSPGSAGCPRARPACERNRVV